MGPRSLRLAAALALLLLAPAHGVAAEGWRVLVDGRPELAGAAVALRGATVWIELAAAAPVLDLQLLAFDRVTALRDAEGVLWRLSGDGTRLESPGRSLSLGGTALGFGGRVFLPAATLALLGQRRMTVDPARHEVRFVRPAARAAAAQAPEGWQPLVLPKPQAQLAAEAEARRIAALAAPGLELVTPEERASMRVGVGLGHLVDGDWGLELSASGRLADLAVSLDALAATDGTASELTTGRLLVGALDRRWTLEAGDLYGDLSGGGRGLRLSRALGSRWNVDVAALTPRDPLEAGGEDRALVGLRWAFDDRGGLLEAAADSLGGGFARASFDRPQGGFSAFGRRRVDLEEESYGASARWAVRPWLLAQAGATRGRQLGEQRSDWAAAVTASLAGRAALTAESSSARLGPRRLDSTALGLAFGLGPSRWTVRYQDLESTAAGGAASRAERLAVFVSAPVGRALSFAYQGSLPLGADGGAARDELSLRARLSEGSLLEVAAPLAAGALDEQLRLRWTQRLGAHVELIAETGRLAPFTSAAADDPTDSAERGVRLLLRTQWDVATPAGGADVSGRVLDSFDRPVADVAVRLGEYRVLTAADGTWAFRHVPRGDHELAVEPAGLAGRFEAEPPTRVEVGDELAGLTLRVLEKVEIQGRVCLDADRDGWCEKDEALADVAVEGSGRLAVTGEDGSFLFRQLSPGRHLLRLVTRQLPPGVVPASPAEIAVEVEPGRRTGGYVFLLVPVERPIVFGSVQ
ncbi:MAG TPA: carboxypeptidase-like regulatory domain-containing protein [Thermoanaerobaculia bacterium]|nr:carboxypeptidase-like regulatory domain-containing protein [Thermoanaerobaculia bacterium]